MEGKGLFAALLDLVFAPICLGCGGDIAPGDAARHLCRRCRSLIRPVPSPGCPRCGAPVLATGRSVEGSCAECRSWPAAIAVARSACLLIPPADRLVHQLKYGGWRAAAEPMAGLLPTRLPGAPGPGAREIVVPVPTTAARLRERGYNQAELLAAAYARRIERPMRPLLVRAGEQVTQTALQAAARGANVAGAFAVAAGSRGELRDAWVILVDDVLTTGATVAECTRVLAAAGVRGVRVVTFARALDARRLLGIGN